MSSDDLIYFGVAFHDWTLEDVHLAVVLLQKHGEVDGFEILDRVWDRRPSLDQAAAIMQLLAWS